MCTCLKWLCSCLRKNNSNEELTLLVNSKCYGVSYTANPSPQPEVTTKPSPSTKKSTKQTTPIIPLLRKDTSAEYMPLSSSYASIKRTSISEICEQSNSFILTRT